MDSHLLTSPSPRKSYYGARCMTILDVGSPYLRISVRISAHIACICTILRVSAYVYAYLRMQTLRGLQRESNEKQRKGKGTVIEKHETRRKTKENQRKTKGKPRKTEGKPRIRRGVHRGIHRGSQPHGTSLSKQRLWVYQKQHSSRPKTSMDSHAFC